MKTFYDIPTQVLFHDVYGWNAGIAFEDKVICACCGSIFTIDDLLEYLSEGVTNPIYEYKTWISVTNDITGDFTELPKGLTFTEDNEIKEVQ